MEKGQKVGNQISEDAAAAMNLKAKTGNREGAVRNKQANKQKKHLELSRISE